ncbi:cobalamin-binding protein [Pontibacter sp. G13]|uniref:cobalamin-binding protein n=1 Tax=Pontibacter sp. G13 TaxID=3074898 RepID=UPI00288A1BD1|nr:cobalamin-binding protein [Pontibacter sp. G13]WNJ18208.1 cobalamin-binding protein [Pontibacter sp. G13]
MRIVSLIPSATEMVYALGLGECLVGRSHECDFPLTVQTLPICCHAHIPADVSSREIDDAVKDRLSKGLSIYEVDTEVLEQLQPDFIITQTQCEVCAVSLEEVERATCQLVSSNPKIVDLAPMGLSDIFSDLERLGEILGVPDRAHQVVEQWKVRMEAVNAKASILPNPPKVACIEWIDPIMNAGNWVPELVEMAGGINLFGERDSHSHYMELSEIADAQPDLIVIMACGYSISQSGAEMHLLTQHPDWNKIPAVRKQRVFIVDGNQYFNRPGPRVVDSLEILTEIFHPESFPRKHGYADWILAHEYSPTH